MHDDPTARARVFSRGTIRRTCRRDEHHITQLQTFMCNSVAKRFDDPPALYAILNTLRDRYQITQLQTFVCGGVAARFKDPPALYAILDKLVDSNLEQLMCNSLAARFDEPQALFAALDRLQECMGKGGVMLCRSTSFASRLFKPPEFVDTVLDIAVHLHTLADPGRCSRS